LDRCRIKTAFDYSSTAQIYIKQGDARNLDFIQSKSVDLICTHPSYADIIHYSDGIDGDLSNYSVRDFLEQMKSVVAGSGHFALIVKN
jgi:hypothetical protein